MKKLMLCPKESGNTYQVCSYVSTHSDAELMVVNETEKADLSHYDVIILASGVYGGHAHKNILNWIGSIQADAIRPDAKIHVFLTWIGRGTSDRDAYSEIKRLLSGKGITPQDSYMKCFGKGMGFIRRSHPDEEDDKRVLSWVNDL